MPSLCIADGSVGSRSKKQSQRFRIEPGMKVRIGRLVKVLSIFGHATEGTANSHGFFEGGIELTTPFEGCTSRKIAMKIPGASRSIGTSKSGISAGCRSRFFDCWNGALAGTCY